jgi:phospholipid/cholesterol/gamma-HCH transport system substrate-binding protein
VQKQAPTLGRIMIMATFTLSCFGLLLFLWSAFGGPVPLKPRGYEFKASFAEATQLAQEADVRISGVPVGKVKKIELGDDGRTLATIELQRKYAPIPSDSRAILRQKTLLGETYVELTPGTKGATPLPEGGHLDTRNVASTVELDEIFRSFDTRTRQAFQVWQQEVAKGIQGNGANFSDALGSLEPFAVDTNDVLKVLNSQSQATRLLIRNTGQFFKALTAREQTLADLIVNSNRVFATTGERNRQIAETFRALPTFIEESKKTLRKLEAYAANTNPLITDLHPWAREASKTLVSARSLAPGFNHFMQSLGPATSASKSGLPAGSRFLNDLRPLLGQLDPFLRNFNPFLRWLGLYNREFSAFFANITASLGYNDRPGEDVRALRLSVPVNPETLAVYPRRIGPNRSNPYFAPGAYNKLKTGLEVFDSRSCANGGYPDLAPPSATFPEDLRNRIIEFFYQGTDGIAPPCVQQGKLTAGGETTQYPHVREDPRPSP